MRKAKDTLDRIIEKLEKILEVVTSIDR